MKLTERILKLYEKITDPGKELESNEFALGAIITDLSKLRNKIGRDDPPNLKKGIDKVLKELEKAEDDLVDLEKSIQ
jgi:hypothetical protein